MKKLKNHLKSTTSLTPADPLVADFRNFLYAVWEHLGLPDPTEIQYDIANYLQHGPKRLIIEAFRGVGKSWETVSFVLWVLYCNPQMKVLVVSASAPKAHEFSTFTLRLIHDMPLLHHLRPKDDQRRSMTSFDVGPAQPDQSPSVKSVGITGQIAGSRADVIVADDIEVPLNSDTQGKRDKLLEAVKEFDAVLKPGGRIIYLGTPQTEHSIYNVLPERGYVVRIWPARFPKSAERYAGRLAPYVVRKMAENEVGRTTEPLRFSDEDLRERELSYGRSGFALQFMLDTSLSDADRFPLKLNDLIVYPLDPYRAPSDLVWASSPDLVWGPDVPIVGLHGDRYFRPAWTSEQFVPYEGEVMFIDPSGRGKDETSYAVVKMLHGRLFLTAAGGFLGGYEPKTLEALLMIAKKQNVKKIIAEPNFGGGMFTQLLKAAAQQHYQCGIEDAEWNSTNKEMRIIDTLEPVLNQHRLVVCPSVIKSDYESSTRYDGERGPYYRLFYQLPRMVRAKGALAQDDRIDALAGAVAYWVRHMSRDTERAALDHREAALDAQLEAFMQGAILQGIVNEDPRPFSSTTLRRHKLN